MKTKPLVHQSQVGARIKQKREANHFSQEYMADQLKISQSSYSRIETGTTKLHLDKLKSISDILSIDIELLIK